ncbi:putative phenylalanine aminotransferase [Zafaria cholistanensis]|uniref:Aromatic amino acid aminotransferase n=1 Tax=Zafaria cholistanensis TaxID=1682741 RepID=A0A5A7NR53_9MICC|nr:histidinol-phosphate transaminase [Zafaria cholistanensis]GER23026.1 putative phenylalanine aminotransferase [Zafaria cholistanensis]
MTTTGSARTPTPARIAESGGPALREVVSRLPGYVAGRRAASVLTAALASNESHEEPLPSVLEAVLQGAGGINRYPDIAAVGLRERIAAFVEADAAEVAVGPGSVGVLQQILAATCGPGDEVVFAWRSFEAYPILVSLTGATPVPVPLGSDEGHDLEAMLGAVTERTRVVMVCSPNNPTGVAVRHDALARFVAAVPSSVLVLVDEAYVEYVGDDAGRLDALGLFRAHANVCVLRTFSKAYGLAGLRVGYAVAHRPLAEGLRRVALPFGVNSLAQRAAIASLDAAEEVRERAAAVGRERRRVTGALRQAGWDVPESRANFIWLRAEDRLRSALAEAFDRADVLVRAYDGDGIRITLADPETNGRVLAILGDRSAFPA